MSRDLTTSELIKIASKAYKLITDEIAEEDGAGYPFDIIAVLAIIHRMAFAIVEKDLGITVAREEMGKIIELIEMTLKEGAWDEENQCVK